MLRHRFLFDEDGEHWWEIHFLDDRGEPFALGCKKWVNGQWVEAFLLDIVQVNVVIV